jgi:hypothetical protein
MEVIKIEPSNHKPGVILDPDNDVIQFYGASFPEDAITFFTPIVKWLHEYSNLYDLKIKSGSILNATFNLSYLNSSSHRTFLEIFNILKGMFDKGFPINIDWHYEKNDIRILECGQELAELSEMTINLIEYE